MNTILRTTANTARTAVAATKTTPTCASEHDHDLAVNIVLIFISSCIFCIGITGNVLVVYIFQYKLNKRSVTEKLIVFLAYADLLQSVLNPFVFTYLRLTSSKTWQFGHAGCKVIPGLQKIIVSVAIGTILSIAIYRCLVICQLKRWWVNVTYMEVTVVVLSSVFAVPYILNLRLEEGSCEGRMEDTILTRALLLSGDVTFVSVFFVTLIFIYRALNDREAKSVLKSQVDGQRNRRVVFMLIFMTVMFMVTVLPRHFVILLEGFTPTPPTDGNKWHRCEVESVFSLVYMCNSVYNPFIYGKLHTQFRKSVKRTMRTLRTFTLRKNEKKLFSCSPVPCEKNNPMPFKKPSATFEVEDRLILPGISEKIFGNPAQDDAFPTIRPWTKETCVVWTTFTLKRPLLERQKVMKKQTLNSCNHNF